MEESCPILDLAVDLEQENDREWHMLDPEECLQALLELEEIRDRVVLEWPEGEKLAVRRRAGVNQLNLNIRTSQQNWFSLSGHVKVDQDEVIDLKSLLDKIRESHSRFIPLGKGQFLALTQEFRDRLEDLIQFGDTKGPKDAGDDEIQVHPLAALALDDLTRQANTKTDNGWRDQLKRIEFVQDFVPEVPSTLQAELRDYQAEGFVWMARLAHLGVGGCLADDMGLGKTLQSLAVILDRAENGPSLVIAPHFGLPQPGAGSGPLRPDPDPAHSLRWGERGHCPRPRKAGHSRHQLHPASAGGGTVGNDFLANSCLG